MVRPIETLTMRTLLAEDVLEFVNGQDFKEGVRLAAGAHVRLGLGQAELVGKRLLLSNDPDSLRLSEEDRARVSVDRGLESHEWAVDWKEAA